MAKLAAERLEPGMVLARPVMNKNGMIMLGEGAELNDSLIEKIRDMGIESVHVQGMSQPDVPLEALLAALDARVLTCGEGSPDGHDQAAHEGAYRRALCLRSTQRRSAAASS